MNGKELDSKSKFHNFCSQTRLGSNHHSVLQNGMLGVGVGGQQEHISLVFLWEIHCITFGAWENLSEILPRTPLQILPRNIHQNVVSITQNATVFHLVPERTFWKSTFWQGFCPAHLGTQLDKLKVQGCLDMSKTPVKDGKGCRFVISNRNAGPIWKNYFLLGASSQSIFAPICR